MMDVTPTLLQNQESNSAHSIATDEKFPIGGSLECISGDVKNFDVAVAVAAGHANDREVDKLEDLRLRRKLDRHLLPLLFFIFCVQFIDKNSLGASAILGIREDNNLSTNQFNNLGSAFYIGYLIFEWPQNWALQHFPVGKWITFNILLWCIFLGLHPVCKNYGSLFALRFLLGASEGCMTAGLMIITSMFYTRTEIGERLGWTFQCSGIATITSGFISFGVFHADPNAHPNQWQWLYIACTLLTIAALILFYFFFPDNPMTAWFLTEEEKLQVVKRVRVNQNGIETKVWKKHQFIEAITDVKTWIFFFYAGIADLIGGIGVQYAIIINAFGFSTLQTTLLSVPVGVAQIIGITIGCYLLRLFPNSRFWISMFCWLPSIVGGIVQIALPFRNRVGHLIAIYLTHTSGAHFVLMMSWVTSAVSGHTKKTTTSAVFFVGYALGQTLGPQFWKQQYRPKNVVPWAITLGSHVISMALTGLLFLVLRAENKRRDAMKAEALVSGKGLDKFDDFAYLEATDENGNIIKTKVEKAFLDMTDKENLAFRYVL